MAFAPPPQATPEQLKELNDFGFQALKADTQNLQNSNQYIHRSYTALFVMYCTLFVIGLAAAAAAIIKGFLAKDAGEAVPALVTAGLSAASFFTIFVTRPLESMERNAIFSTWLIAAVSAYWTRLMYFNDLSTTDADIKRATDDLVKTLSELADKYAAAYAKYPAPTGPKTDTSTNGGSSNHHQPVDPPSPVHPQPTDLPPTSNS